MKKNIVITGGNGRFGSVLKKINNKNNLLFPSKKKLNILKFNSLKNYLKIKRPKILIHLAGLSRPMDIHDKNINKSIDLNIIGTANIVKVCSLLSIKLVYFSTNYVYPGK
jgi:dTDP-4-dehydrorhamnose reductase